MKVELKRDFFFNGQLYRQQAGGTEIPDKIFIGEKEYSVQFAPKPEPVEDDKRKEVPAPPEGVIWLPNDAEEAKEVPAEPAAKQEQVALSELPKHEAAAYSATQAPSKKR